MSQITLYLDDETEQVLNASASRSGMSKSRWVSHLIRRHARDEWPQDCLALAGAFPDFPLSDESNTVTLAADSPRIPF